MSRCAIFEQANRYVGALKGGLPTAAKRFKEGIYETIRITESCEPICVNRTYPLPCCCSTVYLDCGVRLTIADSQDNFEITVPPQNGVILTEESVYYVPNDGFEGSDEFEFTQGGLSNRVCVEVVSFTAEMNITQLNEGQISLTVDTTCEDATIDWGEGLPFSEFNIVLPEDGLYAPVVSCGNCTVDLDTKYAEFFAAGEEGDFTSLKYNSSPEALGLPLNHGAEVTSIQVDSSGNIYTGGEISGGVTTRKYDSSGTELWNVNHGAMVRNIAVDGAGNVYAVGNMGTGGHVLRKYNSSGTQMWAVSPTNELDAVKIGPDGNIYVVGIGFQGSSLWVYDPDGNLEMSLDAGGIVSAVAVDDNFIYTGGWVSGGATTRKFDLSGTQIWERNHGSIVTSLALDSQGNLFAGGYRTGGVAVRKYNSSGDELWTINPNSRVWALATDANDNVFVGGNLQNNRSLYRYNRNGNLIWDLNFGSRVRSIFIVG